MPRMRRIAQVCCFLSICLVLIVRLPSNNILSGILEPNPQDAERIMMERYAHSLQFKGKVRIKSLAKDTANDRSDMADILPKRMSKEEQGTTVYFPPACKNARHWQMCKKIVPSFMIAGAEHSAADVLYEALRIHPQVWDLVKSNEVYERTGNSSLLDIPDPQDSPFFASQNYHDLDPAAKNLEWYLKYFPSIKDIPISHTNAALAGESMPNIQHYGLNTEQHSDTLGSKESRIIVGECAPSYLHTEGASRRIAATVPEMKAVFIFRDPIDRAYLNYLEQKQYAAGYTFEEIIAEELLIVKECIARRGSKRWPEFLKCHTEEARETAERMGLPNRPRSKNDRDPAAPLMDLIVKGLYYSQLHEFVKSVPLTKVMVLRTEDLYDKQLTKSTLTRLSRFLNLDPTPFTQFPIEIGSDPMEPLRLGGGAEFKHVFDQRLVIQDEDDEDMIDSSDVDEPDFERRAGSQTSDTGPSASSRRMRSSSSSSIFTKTPVFTDPPLELSTRFRLQRVFEPFNRKLVDMFEQRQDFPGWVYDVDRG
ncbi:Bifunctional heparan sulfate N-deacetylase/N-sulfotransferase 1 [Podila epigama]|nr:Bifunctional heparan sulfate N-deacetylase/N-sulfotransferase 1 [Podila epigama]